MKLPRHVALAAPVLPVVCVLGACGSSMSSADGMKQADCRDGQSEDRYRPSTADPTPVPTGFPTPM
ncbi:hypothetical protein SAMN05216223_10966 [Actinacidiphila yanglinensis]|uniref:Lipoprotein n=1 Tax=Actinacidiphila yanglinensis TaxID=310779 RepID=A0A1H6CK40_9ACTN|nr:hypothetical protein [Actinacidiphila yanglinensis]SEG73055.1 hypothetical protein SAMN05216223_10966 [Actinacidiphila yanglinensis]